MSTPEVLANPKTEPEAAHLRNVLRQIQLVVRTASDTPGGDLSLGERGVRDEALDRVGAICDQALARSATNGAVIDALVKENGDLQSQILDLQGRLRQYRDTLIAKGQVGQ
jgi:hypothetical protein